MVTAVGATQWLQLIALGGLAGLLGQGARVMVGLKKLSDEKKERDGAVGFETSRLIISLFIGFIAGGLAAISAGLDVTSINAQQIVGLAGAGYAGSDFIEGLMGRGQAGPAIAPPAAGTVTATLGTQVASAALPKAPVPSSLAGDDYLG